MVTVREPWFRNFEQRSEEWHKWRNNIITASYAGVIMGEPPKWGPQTWNDLRNARDAGIEEDINDAMRHGIEWESTALELLNDDDVEYQYNPQCMQNTIEYDGDAVVDIGASYDGVNVDAFSDHVHWAEIKCPYYGTNSDLYERVRKWGTGDGLDLPRHIYWQMVHQALVLGHLAGSGWIHVYASDDGSMVSAEVFNFTGTHKERSSVYNDMDRLGKEIIAFSEGRSQYEDFSNDDGFAKIEDAYYEARENKVYYTNLEKVLKKRVLEYARDNNSGRAETGFQGKSLAFKRAQRSKVSREKLTDIVGEGAINRAKEVVEYWSVSNAK